MQTSNQKIFIWSLIIFCLLFIIILPIVLATTLTTQNISSNFVTVELQGGLGNQMFQIATAMAFANKSNKSLIMNTNPRELMGTSKRSTYFDSVFTNMSHSEDENMNWQMVKEDNFKYNELQNKSGNVKLFGYFQSWKYFNDIRQDILKEFIHPISLKLPETSKSIVSLHIRRSDYIGLNFYESLNKDYYVSAMEYIQDELANRDESATKGILPFWSFPMIYHGQN